MKLSLTPQKSLRTRPATLSRARLSVKASAGDARKPIPLADQTPEYLAKTASLAVDYEYGFRSKTSVSTLEDGSLQIYEEGKIPFNVFRLASENFSRELKGLRRFVRFRKFEELKAKTSGTAFNRVGWGVHEAALGGLRSLDEFLELHDVLPKISPSPIMSQMRGADGKLNKGAVELRRKLSLLTLNNKAIWDREEDQIRRGEGVKGTPWFVKIPYLGLCFMLDVLFDGRPIQRFWLLETVARIPYFSYISMLHLYESLGWWRSGMELRKIHFAEEYNELAHLLTMEALGGDQLWIDRFIGQHAALFYYWVLITLFFFSPQTAYNFSELIEMHAVHTYAQFVEENAELLKTMPPPRVATDYYKSSDLYYYNQFQTSKFGYNPPRPNCDTLYDVFCNIRDDEGEHVKTMRAVQTEDIVQDLIRRKEQEIRDLAVILEKEKQSKQSIKAAAESIALGAVPDAESKDGANSSDRDATSLMN